MPEICEVCGALWETEQHKIAHPRKLMKCRISFSCDDLEIEVPEGTDMAQYILDNAWDLVKQLMDEPAAIVPESWEIVE